MANKVAQFVKGAAVASLVVPALGVVAHFAHYGSDEILGGDYSLSNRFETAYNINVDPAKKHYYTTPVVSGWSQDAVKEPYWAHPYATYPAHALLALIGGIGAASDANEKRRSMMQQNNRQR